MSNTPRKSPRSPDEMRELYELFRSLAWVRKAIWKASSKELAGFGITPMEGAVLYILQYELPGASQAAVSRKMLVEHHTMSGMVKVLVEKGLVRQRANPSRRNVSCLYVTTQGREALRHALQRRSVQDIMGVLSRSQRKELKGLVDMLLAKAQEMAR